MGWNDGALNAVRTATTASACEPPSRAAAATSRVVDDPQHGQPAPPAHGVGGAGHPHVVGVDDRTGEECCTGEGEEWSGQRQDLGRPRRRRSEGVQEKPDQRRQEGGLGDPGGGAALGKRGIATHQVNRHGIPRCRDHIGQHCDLRSHRSGECRCCRDDPEAGVGGHGPRLERTLSCTPPAAGEERGAEQEPHARRERQGSQQLAD